MSKFQIILIALILSFIYLFTNDYKKILQQETQEKIADLSADCAVVLTGGANRIHEGFDLLSRKQIKKLIISGVYSSATIREVFPIWPFYGNLSEKDVYLDRRSTTTYGNAQQSLPIVEALGCRDILLITSKFHMERAYRTFRGSFPDKIQIIKNAVTSGKGEGDFAEIGTEVLKFWFYSLWAF